MSLTEQRYCSWTQRNIWYFGIWVTRNYQWHKADDPARVTSRRLQTMDAERFFFLRGNLLTGNRNLGAQSSEYKTFKIRPMEI